MMRPFTVMRQGLKNEFDIGSQAAEWPCLSAGQGFFTAGRERIDRVFHDMATWEWKLRYFWRLSDG